MLNKLINSKERVKNLGEVYTAKLEIDSMLNLIPLEIWGKLDSSFLEPSCGDGNFIEAIIIKKIDYYIKINSIIKSEIEIQNDILVIVANIYGIDICDTNISQCRLRISNLLKNILVHKFNISKISEDFEKILIDMVDKNYIVGNTLEESKKINLVKWEKIKDYSFKKSNYLLDNLISEQKKSDKEIKESFFCVIVGNPPYQMKDMGYGASASPLYHFFVDFAKQLHPQYLSMIIPARWYTSGKGLNDFRQSMLNDLHMKILVDILNSKECFPGVKIKGGLCYFLWDSSYKGACTVTNNVNNQISNSERYLNEYSTFIRFNNATSLLKKILSFNKQNLSSVVSSRDPFDFRTNFADFKEDGVLIYARKKTAYVNKNQILKNINLIDKYKVLLACAAEGEGNYPNKIIGKPIVAEPNSCCTETYIVCSSFDSKIEAERFALYLKTKFVRFLIALKKNTQHLTKERFEFVPLLSMNKIYTDKLLYELFNLNLEDIDFIESMIKDMD